MAKIEIKSLSLKDLEALKKRVDKAIANHEKKKKSDALAAVKAKAKAMGYSLADLTNGAAAKAAKAAKPAKKPAKKAAAKPAYRDTENAKNTYGGRGPRPQWLKDALAAGKKLEDFKI